MKNPTLNIIIYGKNILADANKIVEGNYSSKSYSSHEGTSYIIEECTEWNYILIQSEYNQKTKKKN